MSSFHQKCSLLLCVFLRLGIDAPQAAFRVATTWCDITAADPSVMLLDNIFTKHFGSSFSFAQPWKKPYLVQAHYIFRSEKVSLFLIEFSWVFDMPSFAKTFDDALASSFKWGC